jgi:hypothetical protein
MPPLKRSPEVGQDLGLRRPLRPPGHATIFNCQVAAQHRKASLSDAIAFESNAC